MLTWGMRHAIHALTRKLHDEPLSSLSFARHIEIFQIRLLLCKILRNNRPDFFELERDTKMRTHLGTTLGDQPKM